MFDDDETDKTIDRVKKMPLYLKGKEIAVLVHDILSLIDDNDKQLGSLKQDMLLNAYMLCAKIVNAEGGGLYDIRMENAAIIRKAAHELKVGIHDLRIFGFAYTEYYQMVRDRIEEFRVLFIDWVANFNPAYYVTDTWGLFNPPGVTLTDKDKTIRYDNTSENNDWLDDLMWDEDDEG